MKAGSGKKLGCILSSTSTNKKGELMKLCEIGILWLACFVGPANIFAGDVVQKFKHGGTLNWSDGTMEAVGVGSAPEKYLGSARARPMALRAAKVDALRNLLEQTQGVNVEFQTLAKDFAIESDLVRTTMKGAVRNAVQVGRPHYMEDGSVELTMAINYKKQIAPIVMQAHVNILSEQKSTPYEKPIQTESSSTKQNQIITGIIIDAVGLGLRTALAPKILNESGAVVYGGHLVNEDKQGDIVAYDTSPIDAGKLQRVGDSPITIKAVKVRDMTNVVISDADAEKLSKLGGLHNVLSNAQVAFAL